MTRLEGFQAAYEERKKKVRREYNEISLAGVSNLVPAFFLKRLEIRKK